MQLQPSRIGMELLGTVWEPPTKTINVGSSLESGTVNLKVLRPTEWIGLDRET